VHFFLGANYRMTELQGAVARAQLRKGSALIAARRAAAAALTQRLAAMPALILPKDARARYLRGGYTTS
jgi:dTDP-4-amino-4,6-dideoxygalactose transaminase